MNIGNFTYDAKKDLYVGDIVTLSFEKRAVMFVPVDKDGDKQPDYRVKMPSNGGTIELGAAWKRTSEKGQPLISVSLDGPLLDQAVSATLFPHEDGTATLVWNRPKTKAKAA